MWTRPAGKQWDSIQQSTHRLNIWHGAVRSSKTVGANWRWMRYVGLMAKHGIPGDLLMFGKTERTLKRNILDPLASFMGPKRFTYNKGEGEVYMWGRKIHVVGANDERAEGKIRGGTYLAAYGDELTLTPESFFKMLLSRLSLPNARLFGTTNPDSPYHYIKTQYLDNPALNLGQWQFTLDDNPHLDPVYVEELKKEYVGLWYKRYILGLWVMAAGAVYDMWAERTVARLPDGVRPEAWIVDVDYGTSNPCTFSIKAIWHRDGKPNVHTMREYYHDGRQNGQKTDEQYIDDLARFIQDVPGKPTVYVDPSAASFIVAARNRGIRVREANNDVLDGIRTVSTFIQEGRYTVDPSCRETIKSYQSYIWDEKAQKRGEDKPLKENDHPADRDRYGIFTHFGMRSPVSASTMDF